MPFFRKPEGIFHDGIQFSCSEVFSFYSESTDKTGFGYNESMYIQRFFFILIVLCGLCGVSSEANPAKERRAVRLARRLAFEEKVHVELNALYRNIRWRKPSTWRWSVLHSEEDMFLLELKVHGKAGRKTNCRRQFYTWLLLRFPELQLHLRPPRPFEYDQAIGKWRAIRTFKVSLTEKRMIPASQWVTEPIPR